MNVRNPITNQKPAVGTVFLHAEYADLVPITVVAQQFAIDPNERECTSKNSPFYANGPYICLKQSTEFITVRSAPGGSDFYLSEVYVWQELEAYRLVQSVWTTDNPPQFLPAYEKTIGNIVMPYAAGTILPNHPIYTVYDFKAHIVPIQWVGFVTANTGQGSQGGVRVYIGVKPFTNLGPMTQVCNLTLLENTIVWCFISPQGFTWDQIVVRKQSTDLYLKNILFLQDRETECAAGLINASIGSTTSYAYTQDSAVTSLTTSLAISFKARDALTQCGNLFDLELRDKSTNLIVNYATVTQSGGGIYLLNLQKPAIDHLSLAGQTFQLVLTVKSQIYHLEYVDPVNVEFDLVISCSLTPDPSISISSLDPSAPLTYTIATNQIELHDLGQFTYSNTVCTSLTSLEIVDTQNSNANLSHFTLTNPGNLAIQTTDMALLGGNGVKSYEIRANFDNGGPQNLLINSFQVQFIFYQNQSLVFQADTPSDQLLFKTTTLNSWSYQLPPFNAIQNGQAVSLSVDLSCCSDFLTLNGNTLSISDLSDPLVPIQTLNLNAVLSQGSLSSTFPFQVDIQASIQFTNTAPYFQTQVISYVPVQKSTSPDNWTFVFPEYADAENDFVVLMVDTSQAPFVTKINSRLIITDTSDPIVVPGVYQLNYTLSDGIEPAYGTLTIEVFGAIEKKTNKYALAILESQLALDEDLLREIVESGEFRSIFITLFQETIKENKKARLVLLPPTPTIQTIDQYGKVRVRFSKDIFPIQNFELIRNSTTLLDQKTEPALDVKIVPSEQSDVSKLSFTWEIEEITNNELTLQLYFQDPLFITLNIFDPESLQIHFNDPFLFVSTQNIPLAPQSRANQVDWNPLLENVLTKYPIRPLKGIPQQILKGSVEQTVQETVQVGVNSGTTIFAGNFFLNLLIAASLHQIWSMVNTQQLVVVTGLFYTSFPANMTIFFQYLMSIAAFDFFEITPYLDKYLQIESTGPYNLSFDLIGLESLLFVNNMGTMSLLYLIYVIISLFTIILGGIKSCLSYKMQKFLQTMRQNIFYRAIVAIIFETAQMIYLCFFTQFADKNLISQSAHLIHFGTSLAFFSFITLLPLYIMDLLRHYHKNMAQKHLDKKFGSFFSNLQLLKRGKQVLLQPFFFLLRRFLLAFSVTIGNGFFIGQVLALIGQIMFQIANLFLSEPFKNKGQRNLEVINEIILIFYTYAIISIDLIKYEAETKFRVGYFCIILILLHFFGSILYISFNTTRAIQRNLKIRRAYKFYRDINRPQRQKILKEKHEKRIISFKENHNQQALERNEEKLRIQIEKAKAKEIQEIKEKEDMEQLELKLAQEHNQILEEFRQQIKSDKPIQIEGELERYHSFSEAGFDPEQIMSCDLSVQDDNQKVDLETSEFFMKPKRLVSSFEAVHFVDYSFRGALCRIPSKVISPEERARMEKSRPAFETLQTEFGFGLETETDYQREQSVLLKRYNEIEKDILFHGIGYEMFKDKQLRQIEQDKKKQLQQTKRQQQRVVVPVSSNNSLLVLDENNRQPQLLIKQSQEEKEHNLNYPSRQSNLKFVDDDEYDFTFEDYKQKMRGREPEEQQLENFNKKYKHANRWNREDLIEDFSKQKKQKPKRLNLTDKFLLDQMMARRGY